MKCTVHVQVTLCYPLTIRAIPERLRDASCTGAIQIDDLYLLPLPFVGPTIYRSVSPTLYQQVRHCVPVRITRVNSGLAQLCSRRPM